MSSQLDRNQELLDRLAWLEKKLHDIEAYLNQRYEDEYDDEDL